MVKLIIKINTVKLVLTGSCRKHTLMRAFSYDQGMEYTANFITVLEIELSVKRVDRKHWQGKQGEHAK